MVSEQVLGLEVHPLMIIYIKSFLQSHIFSVDFFINNMHSSKCLNISYIILVFYNIVSEYSRACYTVVHYNMKSV